MPCHWNGLELSVSGWLQLPAPCYILPVNLPSLEHINTNLILESDASSIGITECVTLFKESGNLLTKTYH